MTSNEIAAAERCEFCDADDAELFGYRGPDGSWRWFCAAHRIGWFYADARRWPVQAEDDL